MQCQRGVHLIERLAVVDRQELCCFSIIQRLIGEPHHIHEVVGRGFGFAIPELAWIQALRHRSISAISQTVLQKVLQPLPEYQLAILARAVVHRCMVAD